jgi:hypothetical protein
MMSASAKPQASASQRMVMAPIVPGSGGRGQPARPPGRKLDRRPQGPASGVKDPGRGLPARPAPRGRSRLPRGVALLEGCKPRF